MTWKVQIHFKPTLSWLVSPQVVITTICWIARNNTVNALLTRQNDHHFAYDIFKCLFLNENCYILIQISNQLELVPRASIGSDHGLELNRRQVINWTNDDLLYWRNNTSNGLSDLSPSPHNTTYNRQWTGSALVQVMNLFGAKPLSIWPNADSMGLLGTKFSAMRIKIQNLSSTKNSFQMSSVKCGGYEVSVNAKRDDGICKASCMQ